MKKIEVFLLLVIIIFGFLVRLYRFDGPIADWHSWRQADTSAVSRNFIKFGFDFLHPRFDDLSNVPSGLDNPQGYRFVEFPIYNGLQAGLFLLFDTFTIEQWGRLVTIIASLSSSVFIYLIVKRRIGIQPALLSSFFFTFIPFNIFYGRVILPDPLMVTAILGGIYFFDFGVGNKSQLRLSYFGFLFLSLLFTAVALLLKPYAIFFTLPMFYVVWERFGLGFLKRWELWLFAVMIVSPFILWRIWMQQFPEGIPQNTWLFNGGNIRFKGAFFYWLFGDRIGRLILGYWGIGLLVLGFIRNIGHQPFFLSFAASSLLYFSVIARGNIQHDYYQILIMPTIAIFVGLGADFLLQISSAQVSKAKSKIMLSVCMVFMILFGWYFVRDYFNINNPEIVKTGRIADKLIPKDAKVIAPYGGDTSFLYHTNRQGWASMQYDLPKMVEIGAEYLVFIDPNQGDYDLGKQYKVISQSDTYILLNLREKP